jgi:hypothetical protein
VASTAGGSFDAAAFEAERLRLDAAARDGSRREASVGRGGHRGEGGWGAKLRRPWGLQVDLGMVRMQRLGRG